MKWVRAGWRVLWRTLIPLAIALHFLMILAVVTHSDEWMAGLSAWQPIVSVLDRYSMITFANRNFGFFAPSVTPDWNLHITSITTSGKRRSYRFRTPSREMEVKMYSMLGHFGESEDMQDLFARSWAVHVMNDDPDVVSVEIEVTRNFIPSMSEYREGKRIHGEPYYKTTFNLR